jgi:predicted HTH transcriptional regulator
MNKVGVIESVGTGTQEMIKECKELGKPEPEYMERGNTFVVCFRISAIEISERQKKILFLLKQHNGLQNADILNQLGADVTNRTLRRDLNYLMGLGFVRLEGKGINSTWFYSEKMG